MTKIMIVCDDEKQREKERTDGRKININIE
jgi:hypothetical protein